MKGRKFDKIIRRRYVYIHCYLRHYFPFSTIYFLHSFLLFSLSVDSIKVNGPFSITSFCITHNSNDKQREEKLIFLRVVLVQFVCHPSNQNSSANDTGNSKSSFLLPWFYRPFFPLLYERKHHNRKKNPHRKMFHGLVIKMSQKKIGS